MEVLQLLITPPENGITDEGILSIAQVLRTNIHLQDFDVPGKSVKIQLKLEGNDITDEGAIHLARSLYFHPKISSLTMGNNEISDPGAESIAKLMILSSSLTFIDIEGILDTKFLLFLQAAKLMKKD